MRSQTRNNVWLDGKMVLMSGEKLSGKVNYNTREQIIQIKKDNTSRAFSENQIKSMTLTYKTHTYNFMLVAVKNEYNFVKTLLAELIYQSTNNYSYFKRYQAEIKEIFYYSDPALGTGNVIIDLKPDSNKDSFTSLEVPSKRLTFIPLLVNYKGNMVTMNRKSLFETLDDKKKEVKDFMRYNKLKLRKDEDVVKILAFYDKIKN